MASPLTTTRNRARLSDSSRGWLSHSLAALGISALGLAIAGSVAVTASAQPPAANDVAVRPVTPTASPAAPLAVETTDPSLAAFARRDEQSTGRQTRSAAVREAVLQERSAQRAEELAKTDDEITRAARVESDRARQQDLSAAEQAQRSVAAALAKANLQRTAAAAAAATVARQNAETSASKTNTKPTTTTATPSAEPAAVPVTGGSSSPVPGAVVGAHFGQYGLWSRYHTGLDFRASYGTPIKAVKSGLVLYAGNSGDWAGNHVAIEHADGRTTMSSHMSSLAVRPGQSVQAGQVIGYVGQTGRAFGAHLHFEVYPAGVKYGDVYRAIDPAPWLRANGVQTH